MEKMMCEMSVFLKSEIFQNFFFLNWVKFDAEFNGNGYKSLWPHLHGEKVKNLSFFLKI